MSKKGFKESATHLDRFFSDPSEPHGTQETYRTHETHGAHAPATAPKYYRVNLKLKAEYRGYLANASWAAHKSITQYINDLIEADKATGDT